LAGPVQFCTDSLWRVVRQPILPIKGRTPHVSGSFCKCIAGVVRVGIHDGDGLGAWFVAHGTLVGNGLARTRLILTSTRPTPPGALLTHLIDKSRPLPALVDRRPNGAPHCEGQCRADVVNLQRQRKIGLEGNRDANDEICADDTGSVFRGRMAGLVRRSNRTCASADRKSGSPTAAAGL
jgi:hypothetical protein